MKRFTNFRQSRSIGVLVVNAALLAFTSTAWAQNAPNQSQPTVKELQRRILQLEQKNKELQRQNNELRIKPAPTQPSAAPQPAPEPADINDVYPDEDKYRFLTLGADKDYLQAERWRISDQIESFIPPLYEPIRPFHAFILPPGAVRISLSSRLTSNKADFGRDDFYSQLFNDVDVRTQTLNFGIAYGFELPHFHDLTLKINIPYKAVQVSGTGDPMRSGMSSITMDGSGQGLGDVSVTLKKKWLDQGNFGINLATFTGLILPTGDDNEGFSAAQNFSVGGMPMPAPPLNIFGRGPNDRFFPPALQPGQGSFGVRLGAAVTRQLRRSAIHAGVIADILTDNNGITPGNEVKYGVSYVFPPFASDQFSVDLSVFGRYKADSKFSGVGALGPRQNFKYGNVLFFSPSLTFTPNPQMRFFVSPEFRIRQPNKGPSPIFALTSGMTFTF